jgi:hypothetical protein
MPGKGKAKWTVMVYMAGDNELSNRCVDDLREINRVKEKKASKWSFSLTASGRMTRGLPGGHRNRGRSSGLARPLG